MKRPCADPWEVIAEEGPASSSLDRGTPFYGLSVTLVGDHALYDVCRDARPPRWVVIMVWLVAALLSIALLVGVVGAHSAKNPPAKKHHCTHGLSSIGPVTVKNGKVVGGSTIPYTQACLH